MAAAVRHVRTVLLMRPKYGALLTPLCKFHGRPILSVSATSTEKQWSRLTVVSHRGGYLTQSAALSIWPWSKSEVPVPNAAGASTGQPSGSIGEISSQSGPVDGSVAAPTDSQTVFGYIPEPPTALPDISPDLVLNALGEPTLASLGLSSWWPPGWVQWGLESLHVGLDIPWWGAIVVGTLVVRLAMFPLVVKSQKNAAAMHNHMPTMQRLMQRINEARASGDLMLMSRLSREYHEVNIRNDIHPWRNFLPLLVQLPVFVSVFKGLRDMANLPVESMRSGGMLWFTDLTLTDPYYALPIITAFTLLATFELGADGARTAFLAPAMKMVMRMMPLVVFAFTLNFPAAMCFYWLTSNTFSLCQVMLLKLPAVRQYFNIPLYVNHQAAGFEAKPKKGFMENFRESAETRRVLQELQDRERVNAVTFRQAGLGKPPKTFPYDPTKVTTLGDGKPVVSASKKEKTL